MNTGELIFLGIVVFIGLSKLYHYIYWRGYDDGYTDAKWTWFDRYKFDHSSVPSLPEKD